MGRKTESVRVFSSLVWAVVAGGALALSSTVYYHYRQDSGASLKLAEANQTISTLKEKNDELSERNDRLRVALKYSTTEHLLARIWIDAQFLDPGSGKMATDLTFVEINDEGAQIGEPQKLRIYGTSLYVEGRVVKFKDDYVQQGDQLRGSTLMQFWRVWGNQQESDNGMEIETLGTRPTSYARGGVESEFEQKLWDDFLLVIRDPKLADKIGARNVQFEAPSLPVQEGDILEATIRASGGIDLKIIATKGPATDSL